MQVLIWVFIGSNFAATVLLAFYCHARMKNHDANHKHAKLATRLSQLEDANLEMQDQVSSLRTLAKRAYGRESMRKHREKQNSGIDLPDPREDPEGWKREMMKRHVLGGKT